MDKTEYKCQKGVSALGPSSSESADFTLSPEMEENTKAEEECLSGASSECLQLQQDGAGEPGNSDLMTKMMMMMLSKGGPDLQGSGGMSNGVVPDIMSMMTNNAGLPDMTMLSNGEGVSAMSLMSKGGMPDMSAMMSKGGFQAGPMGMAKLFECIIDISLARADSEASEEDDDDDIRVEIPCQYCSRSFSSQMSLMTHILVAHDEEDTSVLNVGELITGGKVRRSSKDGSRRKQSQDNTSAADAAGSGLELSEPDSLSSVTLSQEDLSAAESGRGIKRKDNRESEIATSGAAADDVFSPQYHQHHSSAHLEADALSSTCDMDKSPESRKRKVHLRSQRSFSGESVIQAMPKRSKGSGKPNSDSGHSESESCASCISQDKSSDSSVVKNIGEAALHKKTDDEDPSFIISEGTVSQEGFQQEIAVDNTIDDHKNIHTNEPPSNQVTDYKGQHLVFSAGAITASSAAADRADGYTHNH